MKTITVIEKIVAVSPEGKEYSPYGASLLGSTIKATGKYTWELNDNGRITIGLCRQPADNLQEAITVAKNLEKLGYKYKGVRKNK